VLHGLLRAVLSRQALFGAAWGLGRALRFALPKALGSKFSQRRAAGAWPRRLHARKVLLLNGCTQPAMAPSIDAATARVLDAIGVQALVDTRSGCCGALRHHLHDQRGALDNARRNIDAWWPQLQSGAVEAIVINASGCAMIRSMPRGRAPSAMRRAIWSSSWDRNCRCCAAVYGLRAYNAWHCRSRARCSMGCA
jgi:glycolate oxidase iron-sulfur subunit